MGKHELYRLTLTNRAVFLDRDGVINRVTMKDGRPHPPSSLDNLEILPHVSEAIQDLRKAGFLIIVVTNQPDVATGVQQQSVVEAIHHRILESCQIDEIKVCFHVDSDMCSCRKPKPGMILAAGEDWFLDLEQSFMVGDRWRDVEAGQAAGCQTIFIDSGYEEQKPENPSASVTSLLEASKFILSVTI